LKSGYKWCSEKVRGKLALLPLASSLLLIVISPVAAECQIECLGCRDTIKVIPVGSPHTGEPIVTGNTANLIIFHTENGTNQKHLATNVLNEATYNALDQILIDDPLFMTKDDFQLVTTKKYRRLTQIQQLAIRVRYVSIT